MVSRKLNFLLLKELRQDNETAASKRPLFEKSGAKTFVYAGPWAVSAITPTAQHK
jgi:hypothetical protein